MSDIPSRLGKYEIVGILGQGAMGVVYEGHDSVIERRVAIKTIRAADFDAEDDPEPARRFMIEARAAGKLNHPHIVSLYDHGDDAGTVYLVMELVSGRELQRHIDGGARFGFADTLRMMGELLSALGYSHRNGVVHRDVKPANIFITDEGSVKLGDFGIARIEASQRTRVGTLLGTPSHMAPEQIRGEAADARSDLYAAGVVLYELLTGRRPFTGPMLKLAMKVLSEAPAPPSTLAPELTPAIDAVVMRALAKAPAERYQSAIEFWQALAAALGPLAATDRSGPHLALGEPALVTGGSGFATPPFGTLPWATATRPSPSADAATPASAAPTATSSASTPAVHGGPARRGERRNRPLLAGAGLGLVLVLGAAWLAFDREMLPIAQDTAVDSQPMVRTAPATSPEQRIEAREQAAASGPPPAAATPPGSTAPMAPQPAVEAAVQPRPADPVPASPAPRTLPDHAAAPTVPATAATRTAAALPGRREPPRAAPSRPPSEAAPPVAAAPAPVQRPTRCSDILLKASLEPLSDEEGSFLRRECR